MYNTPRPMYTIIDIVYNVYMILWQIYDINVTYYLEYFRKYSDIIWHFPAEK